jgi:hypothetical protein
MAGGAQDVFERARRLLEVMGRPSRVGPAGTGQLSKLVNQMIVASTIVTVAEAVLLAERGGADPAKVREALLGGFADSTILRQHCRRSSGRAEVIRPGDRALACWWCGKCRCPTSRERSSRWPRTASTALRRLHRPLSCNRRGVRECGQLGQHGGRRSSGRLELALDVLRHRRGRDAVAVVQGRQRAGIEKGIRQRHLAEATGSDACAQQRACNRLAKASDD